MTDSGDARRALDGHCLCGGVTLSLRESTGTFVLCHCSQCRKAAGAAFQAVIPATPAAVTIGDPYGLVREYRSSANKVRTFCTRCGSPLFSRRYDIATLRLRAGLFDDLGGRRPVAHIFAAAAATWDNITDALPRHAALEPGRGQTAAPREEDA
ncbi:MAG: GFA family protein [Gammaproteobacteria bacterium]